MLAGGRWSRILAVLNTFCGALSSGLYRPLPAGSTTAFNNSPQSAGNCPKTLCNAGVPAGKKKLQRRALPARRRRYKAQMHPFSEFWDSLAGVTNPNRIAFLPTFMTHTQTERTQRETEPQRSQKGKRNSFSCSSVNSVTSVAENSVRSVAQTPKRFRKLVKIWW